MVLINDKKFACATCIKGHRVSGCTHTDRPLFEVKKKGRPTAQCQCCRDRRKLKGSSVHSKCTCGDSQTPSMILPGSLDSSARRNGDSSVSSPSPTRQAETETRKGQPGSTPTYPNGLKDVHEMAAAAEVLGVLSHEGHMAAERQLSNLLNPCTCKTTGICKCCSRKRERLESPPHLQRPSPSRASSGAITPTGDFAHAQVTESLIDMFQTKATTETTSETSPTTYRKDPSKVTGPYLSPENTHHPAHTSRHVHKTKLYSPYSTNGHLTPRHGKREASTLKAGWASSSTTARPPPPTIPPLADMTAFLGAVFREDGSVATEIPRSALGLPGINTFDAMAQNGGVKVEAMEIEGDRPISFPTSEDVVIGACTCGPDCQCPGCATHADPTRAAEHHHSGLGCGDNCKSCFDCADHLSLPSGITSIAHLLSIAAANVPPPARKASLDLDAHDTRVLPSSEDAVRSLGFVQLKPLQCCNGRCQCAPGECKCEQDCCGCCVRCNCDADGDQNMAEDSNPTLPTPIVEVTEATSSCCGGSSSDPPRVTPVASIPHQEPHAPQVTTSQQIPAEVTLGPDRTPQPTACAKQCSTQPAVASASGSGAATPPLRRAASTSQGPSTVPSSTTVRRATVGVQRSTSTGKAASKALALHQPPHHPRLILPKPPAPNHSGESSNTSSGMLNLPNRPASTNPSQNASPNQRPSIPSNVSSRSDSPVIPAINPPNSRSLLPVRPTSESINMDQTSGGIIIPSLPPVPQEVFAQNYSQKQPASELNVEFDNLDLDSVTGDIMAFIAQFPDDTSTTQNIHPQLHSTVLDPDSSISGDLSNMSVEEMFAMLNRSIGQSSQSTSSLPSNQTDTSQQTPSHPMNDGSNLFNVYGNMGMSLDWNTQLGPSVPNSESSASSSSGPSSVRRHSDPDQNGHPISSVNPNVIDLSKPLNAADVDRIIRALHQQQERQTRNLPAPPPSASLPITTQEPLALNPQCGQASSSNSLSDVGSEGKTLGDILSDFSLFDPLLSRPEPISRVNPNNPIDHVFPTQIGTTTGEEQYLDLAQLEFDSPMPWDQLNRLIPSWNGQSLLVEMQQMGTGI